MSKQMIIDYVEYREELDKAQEDGFKEGHRNGIAAVAKFLISGYTFAEWSGIENLNKDWKIILEATGKFSELSEDTHEKKP